MHHAEEHYEPYFHANHFQGCANPPQGKSTQPHWCVRKYRFGEHVPTGQPLIFTKYERAEEVCSFLNGGSVE